MNKTTSLAEWDVELDLRQSWIEQASFLGGNTTTGLLDRIGYAQFLTNTSRNSSLVILN
jgi:hypothetical protein